MRGTLWVLMWKVLTDFCGWSSLSWLALRAWARGSQAMYKLPVCRTCMAELPHLVPSYSTQWKRDQHVLFPEIPCSSVHQGVGILVQHLPPLALNHGSLGLAERCHQLFMTHGAVAGFTLSLSNRATPLLKHSSLLSYCWHIFNFKKYLTR